MPQDPQQQQQSHYIADGDMGFTGLNTRESPLVLQPGMLSVAKNVRLDRGVIYPRKGAKRLTTSSLKNQAIYGSCVYTNSNGTEVIVVVLSNGIRYYDPDGESTSLLIPFPNGQTVSNAVDVYQAKGNAQGGYVYILRGFGYSVLRWDGASTIVQPSAQTHNNFPQSPQGLWYGNRHIVQDGKNSFAVSHYLADSGWNHLDRFTINDGGNDSLVSITPWTLNEFIVFMRNSAFYCSVGVGAFASNDPVPTDSYVKSLVTDIGCLARRSVVQVAGGVLFLSDNGLYMLEPAKASAQEGMRLLTLSQPMSASLDDVIATINAEHADKAVAVYFQNRYYLAIPTGNSTTNNTVLVFNFINKNWESIDTYTDGFDIKSFHVAKKGKSRKLFAIDSQEGIFQLEELLWDEYDEQIGTPVLDIANDSPKLDFANGQPKVYSQAFIHKSISSVATTRAYGLNTSQEKRYSHIETECDVSSATTLEITAKLTNPDSEVIVDKYNSTSNVNTIRRTPVRKIGQYMQVSYKINGGSPALRNVTINAVLIGKNIISKH